MKRALVLDMTNGQVWRGKQRLELPPKAFAVLCYLTAHAGRVVSKEELFTAVWPGTVVSEWALTTCLRRIRRVLGDQAQTPRYIETVHRRGYRFIGPVGSSQLSVVSHQPLGTGNLTLATGIVGREKELGQLRKCSEKALVGERQVVFVTGEAGIGKTALVDAFLAQVGEVENQKAKGKKQKFESPLSPPPLFTPSSLLVTRGQCIEHHGTGEAYLPVLAALGQLCREPGGERLIALLSRYAPTWLVQMPWLLSAAELEALQRQALGATRERMLREIAEALEVLTSVGATHASPLLILVLEDLQWSDVSTLDLLSYLAQRREPARLLVLGTYRPVEVIVQEHPLRGIKQELQMHGQCAELRLEGLTEADVTEYLAQRFAAPSPALAGEGWGEGCSDASPLQRLARVIHRRTDGHPLFMVNVVNDLVAQGVLSEASGQFGETRHVASLLEEVEQGVPENIRQMIEKHIERLSAEERRVLEVASVAGVEFSTATIAAALEAEVDQVEERCEGLARREQFLRSSGISEWRDGTVAARYSFLHALYQSVLYQRVTAARRLHLHQRVGERKEVGYGDRAGEIAAELAVHFEQGRDYQRVVQYHQCAAETALRRSANQEAITHLTKGLELLKTLPDTPERVQQELMLQISLGVPLAATRGYAAPEVEQSYARARELCRQIGETPQLFPVLFGLGAFYFMRGELQTAHELWGQLLPIAQSMQDPALLLEAHIELGAILLRLGELTSARLHLEQGIALYDPQQHSSLGFLYMQDPKVCCLSDMSCGLWLLGYPDQALKRSQEALTRAQELSHPFSLAFALIFAAWLHQFRREGQAAQERAEMVMTLSTEQGFPNWLGMGAVLRGWTLAEQGQSEEGIAQMCQGVAAFQAIGAELNRPYHLALLAEGYGKAGHPEEGLSVLAEALVMVDKTGERIYEAELWRLKGQLTRQQFQVSNSKFQVQSS